MNMKTSVDSRFVFEIAMFECFDVRNQKIEKQIDFVKESVVKKSPELKLTLPEQDLSLPTMKEIFKVTERKLKPVKKPCEVKINENLEFVKKDTENLNSTLEQIFMQIAFNYSSANKQKAIEMFETIKATSDLKLPLQSILPAKKVLLASGNGMVLEFDDELDADILNKAYKNSVFQTFMKSKFSKPFYVIGFDADKLKKLSLEFQELRKLGGPKQKEPDLETLQKLIQDESDIESIALELFK